MESEKLIQKLLKDLAPRTKDVIVRRFSLDKEKRSPQTLELIGKSYNITRERVRQVESDGMKRIKEKIKEKGFKSEFSKIESGLLKKIKDNNGIIKEQDILQKNESANFLILSLSKKCKRKDESEKYHAFWYLKEESFSSAKEIINLFISKLKKSKEPLEISRITEIYKDNFKKNISKEKLLSILKISKRISASIDNEKIGLSSWSEIKPKTIRDKISVVFKGQKKPLHFKEITELIVDLNKKIKEQEGVSKSLHPQTVHNELIRNSNFVLVGRGYYALKDWGYNPGQVREVISSVLKHSNKSLRKEEIMQEVLKQRIVKESTIMLNLQNKKFFRRDERGGYQVREA